MTKEKRFRACPKCKNEVYDEKARFCPICGFWAYNECEGTFDGEIDQYVGHKNEGNARFCETCGKKTRLFQERLLRPFDEVLKG